MGKRRAVFVRYQMCRRAAAVAVAALVIFTFGGVGCRSVDTTSAAAFSTGVTAVRTQTTTAFGAVAALTRSAEIEYTLATGELRDQELEGVPSPAAQATWNRILDPLEHYGQQLAALASGQSTKDAEEALRKLTEQFNATAADLEAKFKLSAVKPVPTPVAGAVSAMAGAFLRARGSAQAVAIARAADPQVRAILTALADAIGATPTDGLRQIARNQWKFQLDDQRAAFRAAQTAAARRPLLEKYIALAEQRDAQDRQLALLRGAYLTLADAHSALAQGDGAGLSRTVTFLTTELSHAETLQQQFAATAHH